MERGDKMLKQLLNIFCEETNRIKTKQELAGYFYATCDMLYIMVSNHAISQCAYEYLLKRTEKIKCIIDYKKFNDVGYLLRLEKAGKL